MKPLIELAEVVGIQIVAFAVIFVILEIILYVRRMLAFSEDKELILFRIFVTMAAISALGFLICYLLKQWMIS